MKRIIHKFLLFTIYLFTFSIPLEEISKIEQIGSVTRLIGIILITIFIPFAFFKKRFAFFKQPFALFFIFAITSVMWSQNTEHSIPEAFTYLQLSLLGFVLINSVQKSSQVDGIVIAFIVGCFVLAVNSLITAIAMSYSIRVTSFGQDPNELTFLLSLGIILSYYIFRSSIFISLKWFTISNILVSSIAIINSGSRTGFVLLLIAVLYILISNKLTFKIFSLYAIIGIVFFILFERAVNIDNVTRILEIREQVENKDFTGRYNIWMNALKLINERPVLGFGAGEGVYVLGRELMMGTYRSAHNTFLQVTLDLGIVGLILFLIGIYRYFSTSLKLTNDQRIMLSFALFVFIISSLTLSLGNRKIFIILSILPYIFYKMNSYKAI